MLGIICIPIGYLIGSIPLGYLIAKLFGVQDIRTMGSGNIGATNVWRTTGPVPGIIVMVLDVAKGVAAVALAWYFSSSTDTAEYFKLLTGLAAVLGHIYPLFLGFKGGKGVNTALGVMLVLLPFETLLAVVVFVAVVSFSRYISLGSMVSAAVLSLVILAEKVFNLSWVHPVYIPVSILLAGLIIYTHRANVRRLISGTENRFTFHPDRADLTKEVKSDG